MAANACPEAVVRHNAVRAEIVDGSGRARQPRSPMLRLAAVVIRSLASVGRSRRELLLENIALRQQLATMVQRNRPRIRFADRVFWIVLRRVWARWAEVLVIVKPETVVGWPRAGFRLYWQRLSRRGKRRGRPVGVGRSAPSHPPDGRREPVGCDEDPRRVAAPRLRRLRAHRVSLPAPVALTAGASPELAHLHEESSRGRRRDGFLHRADGELSLALRALRDPARPARHRPRT